MSVDKLGTNCDQCWSTVHCCFTSTETVRLIRTESPGRTPRLSHSSWTLRQIIIRCFLYKPTHVAYASTNRTQIVWIETELFLFFFLCFLHGGKRASCLRACFHAMFEFNVALRPQRPYGLLETGRPYGLLETGRPYGLLETGRPYGLLEILETGRPYGLLEILETGRPYGLLEILETGRPYGQLEILETGRPYGQLEILETGGPYGLLEILETGRP